MSTDVLAIIAIALGAITRALGTDLPGFKSFSKAWRAVIVTGLGVVQGIVDMAAAGTPIGVAAVAVLKTTVPSFVLLIVEAVFGGGSSGGAAQAGGKVASIKPGAPAGPYSAKIVGGPWAKRWISRCVPAIAVTAVMATGCGLMSQVPQWIQQAMVVEQNIAAIISALRSAKDFVFAVSPPSAPVRKGVEDAFSDVALAEAAISELLNAGDATTQEQLDAAYTHLKNAYANLTKLLGELGIVHEAATGLLKVKRGDGTEMVVPLQPLALKMRIVK